MRKFVALFLFVFAFSVLAFANETGVAPKTIEFRWEDGAYVSFNADTPDATHFMLIGKNFQPSEDVKFVSRSGEERLDAQIPVNSKGCFNVGLSPSVIGKSGGEASVTLERATTDQIAKITYVWGSEAVRRSQITADVPFQISQSK